MSIPKPPFHSVTDELLYNIYLKVGTGNNGCLTVNDINTLVKLNSILTDAVLLKAEDISNAMNLLRGNVPDVANSLEKLYSIIQGLTYLKREDIDTLSELNAILLDADLLKTVDLTNALSGLNIKTRSIQFYFADDHWDDDHKHNNNRNTYAFQGKINSLSQILTDDLSGVTYKSRLDSSRTWTFHANLNVLQNWIDTFITGDEETGTIYWLKCLSQFKAGRDGDAVNIFKYNVL